jgi:hypothetical protein
LSGTRRSCKASKRIGGTVGVVERLLKRC